MGMKEKFLTYVEVQRAANATRLHKGTDHPDTKVAYEQANKLKRELLIIMEQHENSDSK